MGKLVVLMITAFVDMVGLLKIIPLLPFYAKHLEHPHPQRVAERL